MKEKYDVVVIGAGPGGYVAAIRCAQLGKSVACVEAGQVGGTCLNVGCIPSKALLDSSHHFYSAQKHFGAHGIQSKGLSFDLGKMMERKQKVVKKLTQGIGGLFKINGVDLIEGRGVLEAGKKVRVKTAKGESVLQAGSVVLAMGSEPVALDIAKVDDKRIVDSTGALSLGEVPARLCIIGAGVIGLELGSVWARLGAEVVILEALPDFLPMLDRRVAGEAAKMYAAQGLVIKMGSRLTAAVNKGKSVEVAYSDASGKDKKEKFDYTIVAVGRRPCLGDSIADGGVRTGKDGRVLVNDFCRTDVEGVYAVGDIVRGPMLAHKAIEEGVTVAERIEGKPALLNYDVVPGVIYTHPEIAWVGKTETQLASEGVPARAGEFPFSASGRALAHGESGGLVRMLADKESDQILGCQIIGPAASDLIQQVVVAMEFSASAEDLALTICGHPTFSEAVHEAACAVGGAAIHIPNKKPAK